MACLQTHYLVSPCCMWDSLDVTRKPKIGGGGGGEGS